MTIGPETTRGRRGRRESVPRPPRSRKMFSAPLAQQQSAGLPNRRCGCDSRKALRAAVQRPGRSPKPSSEVRPLGGPLNPESEIPDGLEAEAVEALPCQGRESGCDSRRGRQSYCRVRISDCGWREVGLRCRSHHRGDAGMQTLTNSIFRQAAIRNLQSSILPGRVGQRQTVILTRSRRWFDSSRAHFVAGVTARDVGEESKCGERVRDRGQRGVPDESNHVQTRRPVLCRCGQRPRAS